MNRRVIIRILVMAAELLFLGWWLHDDQEGRPLVCEQLSPGAKHARQCRPAELKRAREAYRWIVDNVAPALPFASMAGVVSFIEDTGRRKHSTFYRLLNRNDIEGACDEMLSYINNRGEVDPVRVKRRGHERAMCLTKG